MVLQTKYLGRFIRCWNKGWKCKITRVTLNSLGGTKRAKLICIFFYWCQFLCRPIFRRLTATLIIKINGHQCLCLYRHGSLQHLHALNLNKVLTRLQSLHGLLHLLNAWRKGAKFSTWKICSKMKYQLLQVSGND